MFSKTLAACAAVTVFTGSGAAIVNGVSSLVDLKVDSVLVSRQLAKEAAASAAFDDSAVGAIVNGTKKLLTK
jgi:hypothetical protein